MASMSKSDRPLANLRGAVYTTDGPAVVAALSTQDWRDVLQLAGDGLLAALAQDVEGAVELAGRCAAELRERAWEGDEELAAQLEAALERRPAPGLRPLPVDLEELSGILEGDPLQEGGYIDVETGEVWPHAAIEYAQETGGEGPDEDDLDSDRWLAVSNEGSREGYRDLEAFVGTVTDPDRADRLSIAISGRGAFRRFKDVLARWPDELERWYRLSNERERGRARAWLAAEGFAAGPASAVYADADDSDEP
jgi:hypothetical protein